MLDGTDITVEEQDLIRKAREDAKIAEIEKLS